MSISSAKTISPSAITEHCGNLVVNISVGPENFPSLFLLKTEEFIPSLLDNYHFPNLWKDALITPLRKSCAHTRVKNYQSSVLFSSCFKIFERCVNNWLAAHFDFDTRHVICTDISNAFDCINHMVVLFKFVSLNTRSLITWLASYLSNHLCHVSFDGFISCSFFPSLVYHKVPFWVNYYFYSSLTTCLVDFNRIILNFFLL